ncbi:hypothetical protein [Rufibacter sp. LB8]|uniref:hypothetical protein n=1 Tax=Rufibacter sp. LB8 TaxID=2777781 RepID=UPI00178C8042|nr:hypothetical protein [Rufibacter sp. LB8]
MENSNWKPGGTFFKPAPAGLSLEDLAKRAERENIANHGFALVMSNGPMPDGEALEFMQKYVDGELTLRQALDELTKYHGLDSPSPEPEPTSMTLAVPEETANSVSDVPDPEEEYWNTKMSVDHDFNRKKSSKENSEVSLPDLFKDRAEGEKNH